MRRNNRSSLAALAVVAALGLGACATTIEGDTAATSTAPASTTTTIPRGTVAELFGSILGIGASLGNDIASGEMATARAKLADIRATWQAITPLSAATKPTTYGDSLVSMRRRSSANDPPMPTKRHVFSNWRSSHCSLRVRSNSSPHARAVNACRLGDRAHAQR